MDLRECLREAARDRDYCRELADTLMEDIEEISSAHESEHTTFRPKFDRRGSTPLDTEAKCVQLRFLVVGLEDELVDLTQRFAALDRAKASSRTDGLALELVLEKAYIHSTLSMKYG